MTIAALCDRAAQSSLTPITAIFAGGGGDFCALLTESHKSYKQEFLRGIIKAGTSPETGRLGEYDLIGSEMHPNAGMCPIQEHWGL
jgi:hypothetical protein